MQGAWLLPVGNRRNELAKFVTYPSLPVLPSHKRNYWPLHIFLAVHILHLSYLEYLHIGQMLDLIFFSVKFSFVGVHELSILKFTKNVIFFSFFTPSL